jgi:hypothetical protein
MTMTRAPHRFVWLLAPILILACADGSDTGAGGIGGLGGSGGGGTGGADPGVVCLEADARCTNGSIDPITEDESCQVEPPPVLRDACDGTESLERPAICPPAGNAVTYQLTELALDEDCNSGYDLDGCDGQSCFLGNLAPGEGVGGVDNALAGLADFVGGLGGNLGVINQVFYDGFCGGTIDIRFVVDSNPSERCATVTAVAEGVDPTPVFVNLSDDGCMSGDLGSLPISFGGASRPLGNVRMRLTYSADGFTHGRVGATLDGATAGSIASVLIGLNAKELVGQLLDINQELEVDPGAVCDAMSLSLKIGGVRLEPLP